MTLTVPAEIMAMPRFHATIKLSAKWMREKSQHKNSFRSRKMSYGHQNRNELKWMALVWLCRVGEANETVYFMWDVFDKV